MTELNREELFTRVQKVIADALYIEVDECQRQATLMGDLGAESIDFLDITFRVEKEFSIKIPKGEIESRARGDLSDADFAAEGIIQAEGLAQLAKSLPEADSSKIKPGLRVRDIPTLFTVETFEMMVLRQLGVDAAAPAVSAGVLGSASGAATGTQVTNP